jgi:asparagine synthase (glutamine-hydrolysing)
VCGICGIYNFGSREPVDPEIVTGMVSAMIHRGPDDDGFYVDGQAALGMRRLSIIDLVGGAQPIANESRTLWVVSNGEIYNFRELRRELEACGHTFTTRSDTEVIVHAYEQWGLDAFARLNGMFGTAVWDSNRSELILARDPFGIKPLYYWDDGKTVAFASELRSLFRHPRVARSVDLRALYEFITLTFVPSPRTGFEGVSKVIPGHLIKFDRYGAHLHRFHASDPVPLEDPEEVLVERLQQAIAEAVERQMVADVPVGVMLSGGTDSATVASIMSEAATGTVRSFTVGFSGDFRANELKAARETAERVGAEHRDVLISAKEFSDFLPRSIWHLEEPIATTSALAFFKVCELAREHVKVVLTGQGADEPFGGYPRHLGERYGWVYRVLPSRLRRAIIAPLVESLPRSEQAKRAVRSLGIGDEVERLVSIYTVLDEDLRDELLGNSQSGDDDIRAAVLRWHREAPKLDSLGRMLYVDARLALADNLLLYSDKMSMATSLEARVPFLDLELMKLAESIPAGLKIKDRTQKAILKRAMQKWLPRNVLERKKIGFATPIDEWFRGELRPMVKERLLCGDSAVSTYFRPAVVERMLRDHETGREDHKRVLFSLLTFEIWHEQFIAPSRWHTDAPLHTRS